MRQASLVHLTCIGRFINISSAHATKNTGSTNSSLFSSKHIYAELSSRNLIKLVNDIDISFKRFIIIILGLYQIRWLCGDKSASLCWLAYKDLLDLLRVWLDNFGRMVNRANVMMVPLGTILFKQVSELDYDSLEVVF